MTTDIRVLNKLDLEIRQFLTRNPGKYYSQFNIHDVLVKDLDIKDPVEKDKLKKDIKMVLRVLPHKYVDYDFKVKNQNNILYASFYPEKEFINDNNNEIIIDKNEDLQKNEKWIEEIAVINFIIDKNMYDYMYEKDYVGNNILHSLILNNDEEIIKKAFNKIKILINEENLEKKTPIEVINSFKTSNFFMNYLFKEQDFLSKNLIQMKTIVEKLKSHVLTLYVMVFFLFLVLFIQSFLIYNLINK